MLRRPRGLAGPRPYLPHCNRPRAGQFRFLLEPRPLNAEVSRATQPTILLVGVGRARTAGQPVADVFAAARYACW
eukprot:5973608-Lingulodinium_polyedra.AAC.1